MMPDARATHPRYTTHRPRCGQCGAALEPARACADGEPTFCGFHPCPQHPLAAPVYPPISESPTMIYNAMIPPLCWYCGLVGDDGQRQRKLVPATFVVHDRRGCKHVCDEHAAWRQTTSFMGGHKSCPNGRPDGPGPVDPTPTRWSPS
jgi:hypothetical protein